MVLIDELHPGIPEPCVATTGFFDGVHEGHRSLLRQVRAEASREGLSTAVITFAQHPRQVLYSEVIPELLTTLSEKIELLSTTGIDYCLLLPFTPRLASLSAAQFMREIVQGKCNARTLFIGYDHRFGHNRHEGFEDYRKYGQGIGLSVVRAEALRQDEQAISSSLIRHLLQHEGDVKTAQHALGYSYFLNGHVIHGRKLGHQLGFPTANLEGAPEKLLPADGVYAVSVLLEGESTERPGVVNIGCRPTVHNGKDRTVEVHLPHFSGNLYGTAIRITFSDRLRAQLKFNSLDELTAQIALDSAQAEQIFSISQTH